MGYGKKWKRSLRRQKQKPRCAEIEGESGVGRPAQGVLSSTVMAKTAMDADMLATCMFVLGAQKGKELIGGSEGVKASKPSLEVEL
jgi:thiamine biosynthesis lipoprotein ApbE